jgi:rubrerythrin
MKRVASGLLPTQAHLMVAYLAHRGIAAHVAGEATSLSEAGRLADLWVAVDADADRARTLLADYERQAQEEAPDPAGEWRCAGCGEMHAGTFESCWRCGAERGA